MFRTASLVRQLPQNQDDGTRSAFDPLEKQSMFDPLPARVLVAHAEILVHRGILATLGNDARFELAQARAERFEPADLLRRDVDSPHVLVADLLTGIEAARLIQRERIARTAPATAVLVICASDGELAIRAALEAGVQGYLTYEDAPDQMLEAVAALARGQRYLGGRPGHRLAEAIAQALPTPREIDVLKLMASGLGNKAIAARLNIACGTVKTHMKALLEKLDAPTRTAAADIAKRRGLLDPIAEQIGLFNAQRSKALHASAHTASAR